MHTEPALVNTYFHLEHLLEEGPQRDAIVLLGDFNSILQRFAGNGNLVVRRCMNTKRDRGGRKLENILEKYRLRAVCTYFKPARSKAPCTYINKVSSLAPSQIDYIFISIASSSSVRPCKVKWGPSMRRFGRGKYDHGLVSAVFRHRIAGIKRDIRKDFSMLRFDKTREEHMLTKKCNQGVRTALETAAEAKDVDEKRRRLRRAIDCATKLLPDRKRS